MSALAVKLRLFPKDFGIGYLAWYVSVVECDHVQDAMGKPTRLDTWGEGCMVTLTDGTEVPLSNYRVTEEEPAR